MHVGVYNRQWSTINVFISDTKIITRDGPIPVSVSVSVPIPVIIRSIGIGNLA